MVSQAHKTKNHIYGDKWGGRRKWVLTACDTDLLQKLTIFELVKEFRAFYRT